MSEFLAAGSEFGWQRGPRRAARAAIREPIDQDAIVYLVDPFPAGGSG